MLFVFFRVSSLYQFFFCFSVYDVSGFFSVLFFSVFFFRFLVILVCCFFIEHGPMGAVMETSSVVGEISSVPERDTRRWKNGRIGDLPSRRPFSFYVLVFPCMYHMYVRFFSVLVFLNTYLAFFLRLFGFHKFVFSCFLFQLFSFLSIFFVFVCVLKNISLFFVLVRTCLSSSSKPLSFFRL